MSAVLILEDGTSFDGISIGAEGERIGEVVLNTAVVGYQEMMTDPTNAGNILVLTYPLIGNYGVAKKFSESKKCWIAALVIKEASRTYSNWQAEGSFGDFLKKEGVVAISGVDTRTLAVKIRDSGQMPGIVSSGGCEKPALLKRLKEHKAAGRNNHIKDISVKTITKIEGGASGPKVAVLDLGMLNSFLKQLKTLGCSVTLMPYDTPPQEILKLAPDGVIVSNGPEDDAAAPDIAKTVKGLIGKVPLMGISTGHEVIALALGGRLKKMKVGHHGVNYPVRPSNSYKGEITVQNHSFVVDEDSIRKSSGISVTMRNLNDNSIERMESRNLNIISTQYNPASPGFDEVNPAFMAFLDMCAASKGIKRKSTLKNGQGGAICQSVRT